MSSSPVSNGWASPVDRTRESTLDSAKKEFLDFLYANERVVDADGERDRRRREEAQRQQTEGDVRRSGSQSRADQDRMRREAALRQTMQAQVAEQDRNPRRLGVPGQPQAQRRVANPGTDADAQRVGDGGARQTSLPGNPETGVREVTPNGLSRTPGGNVEGAPLIPQAPLIGGRPPMQNNFVGQGQYRPVMPGGMRPETGVGLPPPIPGGGFDGLDDELGLPPAATVTGFAPRPGMPVSGPTPPRPTNFVPPGIPGAPGAPPSLFPNFRANGLVGAQPAFGGFDPRGQGAPRLSAVVPQEVSRRIAEYIRSGVLDRQPFRFEAPEPFVAAPPPPPPTGPGIPPRSSITPLSPFASQMMRGPGQQDPRLERRDAAVPQAGAAALPAEAGSEETAVANGAPWPRVVAANDQRDGGEQPRERGQPTLRVFDGGVPGLRDMQGYPGSIPGIQAVG